MDMQQELDTLEKIIHGILFLYPPGKTVIGCKWVYKTKFRRDGIVERLKARLVARGDKQIYMARTINILLVQLQSSPLSDFSLL